MRLDWLKRPRITPAEAAIHGERMRRRQNHPLLKWLRKSTGFYPIEIHWGRGMEFGGSNRFHLSVSLHWRLPRRLVTWLYTYVFRERPVPMISID